jgi:hypothetical protein
MYWPSQLTQEHVRVILKIFIDAMLWEQFRIIKSAKACKEACDYAKSI